MDSTYAKGFISQFVAISDSFQNMSLDRPYAVRTIRKNVGFYSNPVYIPIPYPIFFDVDFDWDIVPEAPTDLTATAISSSEINLAWTDNATDEDGYKIERSLDGTAFTQIDTVAADSTSYPDVGLSSSTEYWYRVRAYISFSDSSYSNTDSATTFV
jgi:hypothetical protein